MTRPPPHPSIPVLVDESTHYDFDIIDKKGRKVGCRVTTLEADGQWGWLGSALRDGRAFGPSPSARGWHATREERDAAVDRYVRGAQRRAAKARAVGVSA